MRSRQFHWLPVVSLLLLGLAASCDDNEPSRDATDSVGADLTADTAVPDTTEADTNPPDTSVPDTTEADATPPDSVVDVAVPVGLEVTSDKGAYRVWFDGKATLRVGVEATYTVTVQDASGMPVAGLDLDPSFIHLSMGHGGPRDPSATEVGAGAYTITSVIASMSGKWELKVALPGSDHARLLIDVVN